MKLKIFSLLLIISCAFVGLLYPQPLIEGCGWDFDRALTPFMIVCCLVGGAAVLALTWPLGRRQWRLAYAFRALPRARRATVATEFLLVIPVLGVMMATLFSMAEIAHAQIVFRYAAYSAMRAGSVLEPSWSVFKSFGGTNTEIDWKAKNYLRIAAALALSGIDHPTATSSNDLNTYQTSPGFFSSDPGIPANFRSYDVAELLTNKVDSSTDPQKQYRQYWRTGHKNAKDNFIERFNAAYNAIEISPARYTYQPIAQNGDFIKQIIWEWIQRKIDDFPFPSGGGIIQQIINMILDLVIKPLIKQVIEEVINKLFDALGLSDIIARLPNLLVPPVLEARMCYTPPLMVASLFKITFEKEMKLRRCGTYNELDYRLDKLPYNDGSSLASNKLDPLRATTTIADGRLELPVGIIGLFLKNGIVNIIPGDCSGSGEGREESPPITDDEQNEKSRRAAEKSKYNF